MKEKVLKAKLGIYSIKTMNLIVITLASKGLRRPYIFLKIQERKQKGSSISLGKNRESYQYCWVANGKVFIRKKQEQLTELIKNEKGISALKLKRNRK